MATVTELKSGKAKIRTEDTSLQTVFFLFYQTAEKMRVEVERGKRSTWMKTKQEVLDAKQGKMQLVGYIDTENQKNTIQEIDMGN